MPAAITQATGIFLTDSSCGLKQCAGYLKVKRKKKEIVPDFFVVCKSKYVYGYQTKQKKKLQINVFYSQMELFKTNGDFINGISSSMLT